MDIATSTRVGLGRVNRKRPWLAKEIKTSTSYVHQICTGKKVGIDRIQELAGVFDVKVSVFIAWGEE